MFGLFKKRKTQRAEPEQDTAKKSEPGLSAFQAFGDMGDNSTAREFNAQHASTVLDRLPKPASGKPVAAMDSAVSAVSQYGSVNQSVMAYFAASSSFIGYHAMATMAQHWLIDAGCGMKGEEATRKGWELSAPDGSEVTPEQLKRLSDIDKRMRVRDNMAEAAKFNNVFGIRHILFLVDGIDYEKPFNPDSVKTGSYRGMSQIDPYWLVPELNDDDLRDPTRQSFYEPTFWSVNGQRIHRSHFVILKGEEVADVLKPSYRYGGLSTVQRVYERAYAAERTANEGPQLALTKRTTVRKTNLAEAMANKGRFIKALKAMVDFRDNYAVNVIDTKEEMQQFDTTLTDLDAVIMTQFQLVCSIFHIPATKLLGTSPKGFSTGDTDNDMYIEDLESLQGNEFERILNAHYERLTRSVLGAPAAIDVAWPPLKVMSDTERSAANLSNAQADALLYDKGAIDSKDIRDRLAADKDSGYTGLEPFAEPDDIDTEPDTDEALNNGPA